MLLLTLLVSLSQTPDRSLFINGVAVTAARMQALRRLERPGARLPSGHYWYDAGTGAFGRWGGPTQLWLPAALDLGPPCPLEASGGGTSVIINGRALHPVDVALLSGWIRQPLVPGRYRVDAQGTVSLENGVVLFNIFALAAMAQRQVAGSGISVLNGQGTSQGFSAVGDGNFMGACTKSGACAWLGD